MACKAVRGDTSPSGFLVSLLAIDDVLMRLRDEEAESLDDGGPEATAGMLRVDAVGVGPVEVVGVGPLLPWALNDAWLCVDGAFDDAPCPAATDERCDTAAEEDECVETVSSS
jgi:hypothetical protein